MFISIDDAKIYATAFGASTAPTLVGIGGWVGSWELWAEPFSILSQRWHVIGYDHRGTGATIAPVDSITTHRMIDDVVAVLDAYHIEQCVLAAESSGALSALGAALKYPHRITGLVIVDGMYYRKLVPEKDFFLAGLRKAYPATLDKFVEACVPESNSAHIKRWGRQIIDRASQEAAIALYLAGGDLDLRGELHRIAQPTLIIHGTADAIVPIEAAHQLAQFIPHAKLTLFPDAGHVPTLTRPAEVAQAINHFFH